MAVLSIQSSVACGSVGNNAAVFVLQCLGHEVWPVNTARLSNHPGHGRWRGPVTDADEVAQIIEGIGELGVLGRCRAVLAGYLGRVETGRVVLAALDKVRQANPDALFCCDPVMGDRAEGLYVPAAIADFYAAEAVSRADILLPNAFELERLGGRPVTGPGDARAAAEALLDRGPRLVVVTSVEPAEGTAGGGIATVAVSRAGAWQVTTPRLAVPAKGAGDAFAALFLGRYLAGGDVASALADAVSSVFGLIAAAVRTGADELPLAAARAEIDAPGRRFPARRLSQAKER